MELLEHLLALAHELADDAREIARRYFRAPHRVEVKDNGSPVTAADREIESRFRRVLGHRLPDHGIIGEEEGADRPDAEFVWVFDPIDGTKAFLSGKPLFGTLIGLLHEGVPVLGIIDQAVLDERWVGVRGRPSTFNGSPIRVREERDLADAVAYSSAALTGTCTTAAAGRRLSEAVRWTVHDADCYAYGLLAMGQIDLVYEMSLAVHDWVPLLPIVEGAGGSMSDWDGRTLDHRSGAHVLAASSMALRDAAAALLRETAALR